MCIRDSGWYFVGNDGEDIASYRTQPVIKGDLEKWSNIARAANIQAE